MFRKILGLVICVVSAVLAVIPIEAAEDTVWKTEALRELGVYQENPVTYDGFIGSLAGFLFENPNEMGTAENIARSTGMIEGNEAYSGKSTLTVKKAYELAVITLGYKPVLDDDKNYLKKASELGINDGITVNNDDRLRADIAVEILYNMLDAEPLVRTYEGKSEPIYEVAHGENLLSVNRDIYKVKGIMTGTELTSIYGDEGIASINYIKIDDTAYFTETNEYDKFLGKSVISYVKETDTDEYEIIYLNEDLQKNDTVVIECEDISEIGDRISFIKYEEKSGREETIDIAVSPRVIYNGKFFEDYTEDDFLNGTLELTDNNSDGEYDVIKVTSYRTVIVESVDSRYMLIKNKYEFADNPQKIDLYNLDADEYKIYDSTGAEATLNQIKPNNILSVAQSKDKKMVVIYISGSALLEGTVDAIDNYEETISINGTAYEMTADFKKHLNDTDKGIKLGKKYKFFIDYFGKLSYMTEQTESDYKLLFKVYLNDAGDEYCANYMDMNGDWYTSPISNKVSINGDNSKYLNDEMDAIIAEGPQVVLLKVNSKNQIINIEKARKYGEADNSQLTKKTLDDYIWRSEPRYFQSGSDLIYLEDNAKVIVFPSENTSDRNSWKIYNAGNVFDSNEAYVVDCFNLDDFMFTDLITVVQTSSLSKARMSRALYIVTGFETTMIDNEPHPVIKGSVDGFMNLSFVGKDKDVFNGLKKGDVINFALDQNGMIDEVDADSVFSLTEFKNKIGDYDETSTYAGKVESIDTEEGKLMLNCGTALIPFRISPNMHITVYDEREGCVSKLFNSIDEEYNVILRTEYGRVEEMVCVKIEEE